MKKTNFIEVQTDYERFEIINIDYIIRIYVDLEGNTCIVTNDDYIVCLDYYPDLIERIRGIQNADVSVL